MAPAAKLVALIALALAASGGIAVGACTCAEAKAAGGWCSEHRVGYVAGVQISSEMLFEVIDAHGHELDLATFTCAECKSAIESDGFCTKDRIGFVGGQAYFSKLTHLLGKGELLSADEITCPVCRKNAESHGFCRACGIGMAGHIAIDGAQAYEEIEPEIRMLEAAAEAAKRCDQCAFAILQDLPCPLCKISYDRGVQVAPAPPPQP